MTRMLTRRLARLETAGKRKARPSVVRREVGETTEEALTPFFGDGERWPVLVLPKVCRTAEEWLELYAPERRQ